MSIFLTTGDISWSRMHMEYPIPHDKDSVKRFVAFANYYRKFIPNFAEFAQPLTELTLKRENFE